MTARPWRRKIGPMNFKRPLTVFLLATVLWMYHFPAAKAEISAPALSGEGLALVARIETYLNKLGTMKARFLQVSSNGQQAEGDLYLSLPGNMRIEYDPPVPVLIVADGLWLWYFDKELEQVSQILASSSPLGLFLEDKIDLESDEISITGLVKRAGTIRLDIKKIDEDANGSLSLVFSDRPLALKKWTVTDPQGIVTSVTLSSVRTGIALKPSLFEFVAPKFEGTETN